MPDLPQRSTDYVGPVTDSRIWEDFALRPNDVVLSTPPKCGTTWSQAILMMLIHGQAKSDRSVWRDSIWLDCGIRSTDAQKALLDAQKHRRCIKSHTPFDAIPYDPQVTYLTVYRHPIDLHFSLRTHVHNMKADILDFMYEGTEEEAFDRFLTAPATPTGTDDLTLDSFLHHYRSFSRWAHLPNVHFFHYAQLKQDTTATIMRYAEALGMPADPALAARIAEASSFSSMRRTTEREAREGVGSVFTDPAKFFHSATSNKWQGRLTEAQLAAYRQRISERAPAADIHWLETGSPAQ